MVAVVTAGFFIIGSFATTIILAQCMLPNNVGMASGLTIGFSVGLGGFGVTILGFFSRQLWIRFCDAIISLFTDYCFALVAIKIPIPKSLQK